MQSWMPLQKCWTEKCTKRVQDQAINKSFWGSGCRIMYTTNRRFFADILCNNYHPVLYELWDSLGQKVSLSILHSSIQLDSFKTMENESLLQRGVDFSLLPDNIHAFIKKMGENSPQIMTKAGKLCKKYCFWIKIKSCRFTIIAIYGRGHWKYFCIFSFKTYIKLGC